MRYADLDPILGAWAHSHHLNVSSSYRDEEVRSVEVVSPHGSRYQIWLDISNGDKIGVHVWDYRNRRENFRASMSDLNATLDLALSAVHNWIAVESA